MKRNTPAPRPWAGGWRISLTPGDKVPGGGKEIIEYSNIHGQSSLTTYSYAEDIRKNYNNTRIKFNWDHLKNSYLIKKN